MAERLIAVLEIEWAAAEARSEEFKTTGIVILGQPVVTPIPFTEIFV